jgi:hypothetical protein
MTGRIRTLLLNLDHRVALGVGWLRRRLGFRGAALAAFATFDLVWAWSLLDPAAARGLRAAPTYQVVIRLGGYLNQQHPLWPWAIGMGAIGLLLGVQAWMRDDRTAFAAAIAVKVIWAVATLACWPAARWQILRPSIVFLTLAALVSVCAAGLPFKVD